MGPKSSSALPLDRTREPCRLPPRSTRWKSRLVRSLATSTSSMIKVGRTSAVSRYSDAGVMLEAWIARRQRQCSSRRSVVFPLSGGPQTDRYGTTGSRSATHVIRIKAATKKRWARLHTRGKAKGGDHRRVDFRRNKRFTILFNLSASRHIPIPPKPEL